MKSSLTVKELIEALSKLPQDSLVATFAENGDLVLLNTASEHEARWCNVCVRQSNSHGDFVNLVVIYSKT